MRKPSLCFVLSCFSPILSGANPSAADEPPALILSEILADPSALPDAQGEFLELGHPGTDSAHVEGVTLSVDGESFALGAFGAGPDACLLICRDSAAYARIGVACFRAWPGMSLANARPLDVAVAWNGGNFHVTVPAARAGTSWENTWDASAGYADFLPSRAERPGGDSATPGARNSRSLRPAAGGLELTALRADADRVRVTVDKLGSGPVPASRLVLRLDADWDGTAETALDSIALDATAAFPATLEFRIPSGIRGRLTASLGSDPGSGGDVLATALEPAKSPLALGDCDPEGRNGGPEWVEVRNNTATSGAAGRRIGLALATVGGMALGAKAGDLDPGERIILASDTAAFRSRYGALKAKVFRPEPWRALRNSGDTLVLASAGIALDTLSWGPIRAGAPASGSEGAPAEAGWTLSGRMAFPDAPLDVEVRAPAGTEYALRAFDLEGGIAREIGRGGPGTRVHVWDGRGAGGRALPRGAYVLCLSFGDGRARKRAVLAGER